MRFAFLLLALALPVFAEDVKTVPSGDCIDGQGKHVECVEGLKARIAELEKLLTQQNKITLAFRDEYTSCHDRLVILQLPVDASEAKPAK